MDAGTTGSTHADHAPDRSLIKRRLTWEDVQPFPGNPIYPRRLATMRREWRGYDHSLIGSPAICDNTGGAFPDMPEDALVILDGNHRRALAAEDGRLDEEFLADLYRGLSRREVHRRRRGFNDRRTVKPAERFIEMVEEGDPRRRAIVDAVEGLGWRVTHDRESGGLSCTNELEWIWDKDHSVVARTVQCYEQIWGRGDTNAQARVIKGLGAFWLRYPDADMERLVGAVRRSHTSVNELYLAGKRQFDTTPYVKSVYDGIRYVLGAIYNKGLRRGVHLPLA